MMKSMALVCAAMLTFTASAFGMHKAGWFGAKAARGAETRQVRSSEPLHSEAAIRYRQNQSNNWRCVMNIR